MWFDILKESQQIADTKTDLNVMLEPLGEDNDKCCEKFRPELLGFASAFLKQYVWEMWKEADCEGLRRMAEETEEWRHQKMHIRPSMKMAGDIVHSIMNKWRKCEGE